MRSWFDLACYFVQVALHGYRAQDSFLEKTDDVLKR